MITPMLIHEVTVRAEDTYYRFSEDEWFVSGTGLLTAVVSDMVRAELEHLYQEQKNNS